MDPPRSRRAAASEVDLGVERFVRNLQHNRTPEIGFWARTRAAIRPAVLEALARILRQAGLPAAVARRVVSLLFSVVRGTAQTVAELRQAASSGASELAWWSSRAGALRQVAPDFARRFPDSVWLAGAGTAHRQDDPTPYLEREAMEAFTVGLTVLLDGIETAMARDHH